MDLGNNKQNKEPLVSIIVVVYNSEKYVLETLESARKQTYRNLELIIADDGSKDNTVAICQKWLVQNKHRFLSTYVLTVPVNTGIPANCNRGVQAANGEWVKLIAGDDILDERCIELNINFVQEKGFPSISVVSDMVQFVDKKQFPKEGKVIVPNHHLYLFQEEVSPEIQHEYVIKYYLGNTPSLFFPKEVVVHVPFDEELKLQEDRPFAINATKKGYTFQYLNAVTVYYRISEQSVYASKSKKVLFNDFYLKRRPFVLKYIYPSVSALERWLTTMEFYRVKIIDRIGLNKNNLLFKLIGALSFRMSPYYYYKKIQTLRESKQKYWLK